MSQRILLSTVSAELGATGLRGLLVSLTQRTKKCQVRPPDRRKSESCALADQAIVFLDQQPDSSLEKRLCGFHL